MDKIIANVANLIKVKTIVTLVVLFVFAFMAIKGEITPDQVIIVTSNVIAFYFGTQLEKNTAAAVNAAATPKEAE